MKLLANTNNQASNADILDNITSMEGPKRIGLTLFALVFGVFGLWAGLAPLDGAAFGAGTVTVKSYKKIVQHLEGGIVADILVRDGDLVEQGDPLLILDSTQANAQLEIAKAQLTALLARESRLIAERDGNAQIVFSSDLDQSDSDVQQEMNAQTSIFAARKATNEGRREILEQRIQQLENQVVGMRAVRESKQMLADSFAEELADTQTLLEQGFSEKTRLREIERNYASFTGEVAELSSNISATEVQIGETRLEIIQDESEFQNNVVGELGDTQTSRIDANERVVALEDIVRRTTIESPDTGVVNGMQVHTIGGVIGPGTVIAEIVPESDELIVEASINPIDIDRVTEGQEARVRFSTFGSRAPTVFGTVLSLSADSIQDQNTGITYYLARIEVRPDGMEELGDLELLPGMPAEVYINTGSRTFLEYLFKPLSDAAARSFNED